MNKQNVGKVYFTGDLHFGHFNAIKYDCRPWPDVETMAAGMIERWNARVTDDDLVYILGDVCYRSKYPAWHYLEQMRGHKILIVGNHDGSSWRMSVPAVASKRSIHTWKSKKTVRRLFSAIIRWQNGTARRVVAGIFSPISTHRETKRTR